MCLHRHGMHVPSVTLDQLLIVTAVIRPTRTAYPHTLPFPRRFSSPPILVPLTSGHACGHASMEGSVLAYGLGSPTHSLLKAQDLGQGSGHVMVARSLGHAGPQRRR